MRAALLIVLSVFSITAAAAGQTLAPDASADQVLDALKTRGDTLHDFSADVKMTEVNQATADSSSHDGRVLFQKFGDGDGRIRVTFTQRIEGDRIIKENHEYTLAKGLLIERDYLKKIETDREVVKPGEKINLLKLGEGPFPLPIGQDKQDVHKQFDVTEPSPAKDDPPQTVHLLLKPKTATDMARRFAQIDIWVDRQTGMPVQIMTLDATQESTRITVLSDVRVNQGLGDADFALLKVDGWELTQEPYQP
jgi:outer membrane lipoprotein-sorting protein